MSRMDALSRERATRPLPQGPKVSCRCKIRCPSRETARNPPHTGDLEIGCRDVKQNMAGPTGFKPSGLKGWFAGAVCISASARLPLIGQATKQQTRRKMSGRVDHLDVDALAALVPDGASVVSPSDANGAPLAATRA